MTGLAATTAVRVTTRSRVVTNSGGTVSVKAPLLLAVAVAICVKPVLKGKSCFSSATGVEPTPPTVPLIVRPEPHTRADRRRP